MSNRLFVEFEFWARFSETEKSRQFGLFVHEYLSSFCAIATSRLFVLLTVQLCSEQPAMGVPAVW